MGSTAVSVAAALVAMAFAFSTFERWLARRRRHELAWSGALALFVVAAGALAAGAGWGWNGPIFRVFYLFGAILNVPFLALGTVYLLWPRAGDRVAVAFGILGGFAAGVILTAPFRAAIPRDTLVQGSHVFGVLPRVLAGVASGGGAILIFGGCLWSIVHRRQARSIISNGLIALGTVVLGASGLLNSVFDAMSAFALALMVGITIIFGGFLVATTAPATGTATAKPVPLKRVAAA
jgi:MFS family permease